MRIRWVVTEQVSVSEIAKSGHWTELGARWARRRAQRRHTAQAKRFAAAGIKMVDATYRVRGADTTWLHQLALAAEWR